MQRDKRRGRLNGDKRNRFKGYLYVINYAEGEESLCKLEMKVLFGQELTDKYLFSPIDIDPSRSVFVKERLTIYIVMKRMRVFKGK